MNFKISDSKAALVFSLCVKVEVLILSTKSEVNKALSVAKFKFGKKVTVMYFANNERFAHHTVLLARPHTNRRPGSYGHLISRSMPLKCITFTSM